MNDVEFIELISKSEFGITNIPSLPFQKMEGLYRAHPFLISSSRYEGGHSLAILEAMSFGMLIFASTIPSNKEIISDSINGYLISGTSIHDDANRICHIVQHTPLMPIREQAVIQSHLHTWQNQITELEALL